MGHVRVWVGAKCWDRPTTTSCLQWQETGKKIGRLRAGTFFCICTGHKHIGGDDGDADGHCEKDVKKLAQISHSPHYSASESLDPAAQNSKSNGLDSGGGWPEKETLGDPGAALAVP